MMDAIARPFTTRRRHLYTTTELLEGFDPRLPATLADTLDYRIYRYWVVRGRFKPARREGMQQCLHDNAITYAVARLIKDRKVVGIMGGHTLPRDNHVFAQVSVLARRLSQAGFLIVTGGGPGAMEAAQFGAFYASTNDAKFFEAQRQMASEPTFPMDAGRVVGRDGTFDGQALKQIARWLAVAIEVRNSVANPGESLGIPTWRYGHEPTSVFATHIAKYFDNSVREDGLLSIATRGIVYAQGGAGTFQEVFQSAVFNAYPDVDRSPSPMIFLGTAFWEQSGVLKALQELLGPAAFSKYVAATDDIDTAFDRLVQFEPIFAAPPTSATSGPALSLPKLRFDTPEEEGDPSWLI
jgi:predicted Rossmann-fold nucleotide-binding protein